jgi:hypothetical protein
MPRWSIHLTLVTCQGWTLLQMLKQGLASVEKTVPSTQDRLSCARARDSGSYRDHHDGPSLHVGKEKLVTPVGVTLRLSMGYMDSDSTFG